jgi:hypothetical protein
MVTGLEAAGVVLALLPLLVNQLENYATGFEKLKLLRRYRRVFSAYALGIGTQPTIFLNNLEKVLEGVVEDEDKIGALINEPQGNLWKDVSLQDRLKAKLGRSHDVFMGNIIALHDLLVTLSDRLGLKISTGFSVCFRYGAASAENSN